MTDDPRVQHGEPPLTWLCDLYPLAAPGNGAWDNVLGFNDKPGETGLREGQTP
jgi:hypothetical protein